MYVTNQCECYGESMIFPASKVTVVNILDDQAYKDMGWTTRCRTTAACPPGREPRKVWSGAGRQIGSMAGMRVAHDRRPRLFWEPATQPRACLQRAAWRDSGGFQLDHKCRVRCCVNPDQLEVVTK
jgi:hypothetical protein